MDFSVKILAAATPTASEPSILFVALMGMGIVMIGLICIIALCIAMSWVYQRFTKTDKTPTSAKSIASLPQQAAAPAPIPNKNELIVAITAAIAEELGTDVSAIRVLSFRRVADSACEALLPGKGELVAAITAAIAEELGTDVSALRVHSLRKVS